MLVGFFMPIVSANFNQRDLSVVAVRVITGHSGEIKLSTSPILTNRVETSIPIANNNYYKNIDRKFSLHPSSITINYYCAYFNAFHSWH